jgi:hypothetical protein
MKRLIIIILMMLLIPISYVGAEDKETLDLAKDKKLMLLKEYQPLAAKYDYVFSKERMTKENEMADCLDCIEEQKRIIDVGSMEAGSEKANHLHEYESKKNNTSPFIFIILPNIEESQPSWLIQFTYSF